MKHQELNTENAILAKSIAVLSGELMECYQWDENTVDKDAAKVAVDAILEAATQLKTNLNK